MVSGEMVSDEFRLAHVAAFRDRKRRKTPAPQWGVGPERQIHLQLVRFPISMMQAYARSVPYGRGRHQAHRLGYCR